MLTEFVPGAERRTEPRQLAAGEVNLRQCYAPDPPFVGHLMDIAATGFRARHERLTLGSGELVDFAFEGHSGVARAIWTRIVNDPVETGFRICQEYDPLGGGAGSEEEHREKRVRSPPQKSNRSN